MSQHELTIEEIALIVRVLQKEIKCLEDQSKFTEAHTKEIRDHKRKLLGYAKSALDKITKVAGCSIPNDTTEEELWPKE